MICSRSFVLCLALGLILATGSVQAVEFWVAPNGNDAAAGTKDRPFATLERARDAVRAKKSSGESSSPTVVWIAAGEYRRAETFALTADDSGTAEAPVVYRAHGGPVRLHVGRFIDSQKLRLVTDEALVERLVPEARGKIVEFDLRNVGFEHVQTFPRIFSGGGGLCELFCNDRRMPLSRWPNEGNVTMGTVLDRGDWSKSPTRRPGRFVAVQDRVRRWNVADGVWLEGYWRVPWDPQVVLVESIDRKTNVVQFAEPVVGGIGSKYAKKGELGDRQEPWCAVNLLEEIDRPGEWCVVFPRQKLYFWPPTDLSRSSVYLSDLAQPLVTLNGASHVALEGMTFEGGLADGVEIRDGENNRIMGCTFRRLGGSGVVVRGGLRHEVRSSDFYELGEGGIHLTGGDRRRLMPADHVAHNNHLHHLGIRKKTYAAAIHVGAYSQGDAVGCRVTNNLIHDLPHAGVLYGGNENRFEFNEIYRVVLTSADMGAFYTSHDWTSRGNVLRHNFVYDSPRANAFYMDDGDSGDTVEGNVVHGLYYGPFVGGGHDNRIADNLVIACKRGLHLDARGVSRGYDRDRALLVRLESIARSEPPWKEKYPALAAVLDSNPAVPRGNVFRHNVLVDCEQAVHLGGKPAELRFSTVRDNLELRGADKQFVDMAEADLRLRPDADVLQKRPDFPTIPFEQIGLVRDEFRRTLPQRRLTHDAASPTSDLFDSNTDVERSNTIQAPKPK